MENLWNWLGDNLDFYIKNVENVGVLWLMKLIQLDVHP